MGDRPYRAEVLVEAVYEAFGASDWQRLRTLYHDEARLSTIAASERIVGPDELIEVFRSLEHSVYRVGQSTRHPIDDHAIVVTAMLRYPVEGGGFGDAPKAWLLTFRDDLLYRTVAFRSLERARAAYAELGIDCGL